MSFLHKPWYASFTIMLAFLASCASPKTPTGGVPDDMPPAIIQEESTPNQQVLFAEKEIIITFDEWFTLKDVYTQLVISPLMPKEPVVKQKGKSIIITLPDSLREETTYTINFGNAIADLNEGNALENYAFVFSTGSVLDSLKLTGTVTNAVTLKPAEGVWVILYPVGIDSAVYKRKPEYVAKTNKEGKWSMSNIRNDSFDVVALKDDNLNFLYDQDTELFGWLEQPIFTSLPSALLPDIIVFPKPNRVAIREIIHTIPGWIKIIVDAPYPKPTPQLLPEIETSFTSWSGDTLHIWYSPEVNYAGNAILNNDTTKIRVSPGKSIRNELVQISVVTGRLYPPGNAQFSTELPISSIDTSKIILTQDSIGVIPMMITIDSVLNRRLNVKGSWREQTRNLITFLPGAVTDYWGRQNDTVRHSIVVNSLEQFGDLTISAEGLDSTKQYVVFVKSGEQIIEQFVIEGQKTAQLRKNGMFPGKYTIEIFQDDNRNKVWDTGDYSARRQAERKMIFILENLRAGWEQDSKISWK